MKKIKVVGKHVMYCTNCGYTNRECETPFKKLSCPKCNTRCWVVYEYEYHSDKGIINKEAGFSDLDRCDISLSTLDEIRKVIDKGIEVFRTK